MHWIATERSFSRNCPSSKQMGLLSVFHKGCLMLSRLALMVHLRPLGSARSPSPDTTPSQSTASCPGGALKVRARASVIAFLFPMTDPFRSRFRRGPARRGRGTRAGNVQDTPGKGVTDRDSEGIEGARRSVTTAATRCHPGLGPDHLLACHIPRTTAEPL